MELRYSEERTFDPEELRDLFLSVDWESGNHPRKLARAMAGSDHVIAVRDGEFLVGLVSSVSDGFMNAYVPYMVVRPEYQGRGIGRELMTRMLSRYRDLPRTALIAYRDKAPFYERCGFSRGTGKMPMFVSSLK